MNDNKPTAAAYVVTGIDVYGKRFRLRYPPTTPGWMTADGINLYRGTVWLEEANGRRHRLKSVWN